jgi:segregation and condensation protein B
MNERDQAPDGSAGEAQLARAIEAILFSLNRAMTVKELAEVLKEPAAGVESALGVLAKALHGRGLMLQRHHDQVQLVTHPAVAALVQRVLRPELPTRLSPAAYETLAIIAYRQPLTRVVIEEIRGVNCDSVIDSLLHRELIQEVGELPVPGRPRLFGTTMKLLQLLGLRSLEDLPAPKAAVAAAPPATEVPVQS